jgi:hypothetical protein
MQVVEGVVVVQHNLNQTIMVRRVLVLRQEQQLF